LPEKLGGGRALVLAALDALHVAAHCFWITTTDCKNQKIAISFSMI
jgi:hypothetical protein